MGASNMCAKRLKEHLQDQQEPFSLSGFLLERNYMIKNLRSKNLKLRSHKGKYGICKMREKILHSTEIVRSVIINLISTDDSHESSNCTSDHRSSYAHRKAAKENKTAPLRDSLFPHAFWGISVQTVPTTRLKMEETGAVTLHPWISRYEKQQGQRVTQLRESTYRVSSEFSMKPKIAHFITQDDLIDRAVLNFKRGKEDLSTYTFTLPQESMGNSMLSATLGKLLLDPDIPKHRDVAHDVLKQMRRINSVSPYIRKKKIPSKMRQFQLQCVQEVLQFWLDCADKCASRSVLSLQSSSTEEECTNSMTVVTNIAMEIGDAIMEDMVNEIIDIFLVKN